MKKIIKIVHWIFIQTRPVLFYLLIIILISGISSVIGVSTALVSKSLIDVATSDQHELIFKWISILAGVLLIQIGLRIVNSLLSTYCNNLFANTLQTKLYTHIIYSEWLKQTTYHSANIITRLTSDLSTVNNLVTGIIPSIVSLSVTLVTAFITLLYLQPSIAILAIILSPLTLLFAGLFSRRVKKYYIAFQEQNVKHRSFLQESLQNILITKSFCQEAENINQLQEIQSKKFKLAIKQSWLGTLSATAFQIGGCIGYFAVFVWGAYNLNSATGSFGTLTALLQLFSNIQGPINSLAHYFSQIITAFAASERLMILEELPVEKCDKLPPLSHPEIELKQVNFAYKEELPILRNVSCQFKTGEIIGLVGCSGEGKTTLIRLLLSLIHPQNGEIIIHAQHQDYPLTSSFRKYVSYVPQGNTLFSGTIESNLLQGNPNATPTQLHEALRLACLSDFIDELEDGVQTIIGEKGLGLSEGQAQRLAIARAFLRQKPILILDESTSALDAKTEIDILHSIESLSYRPTCIIITHRTSTLSICDKIFNLNSGVLNLKSNYA